LPTQKAKTAEHNPKLKAQNKKHKIEQTAKSENPSSSGRRPACGFVYVFQHHLWHRERKVVLVSDCGVARVGVVAVLTVEESKVTKLRRFVAQVREGERHRGTHL